MKLESVTHCWNYDRTLRYFLGGVMKNAPCDEHHLTATIVYCEEDANTLAVIQEILTTPAMPGTLAFQLLPLSRGQLLRRSIGRNIAALASKADWVLFTDVDYLFGPGSLNAIAEYAATATTDLFYPRFSLACEQPFGDRIIERAIENRFYCCSSWPPDDALPHFTPKSLPAAIGGAQYARGDVVRRIGYCKNHLEAQQPVNEWRRTFEDVQFRKDIGTNGASVALPNIYRIRHTERGREKVGHRL